MDQYFQNQTDDRIREQEAKIQSLESQLEQSLEENRQITELLSQAEERNHELEQKIGSSEDASRKEMLERIARAGFY